MSLELGVLLELPRPAFAIVGVLRLTLPAEEIAIVYLQVNFAGTVDFEKGQIQFDASLFDSRVLTFPLTGDMAVRLYWKDNPNFLLTVGGFHPSYTPPPMNIGQLARVGIVLFQGNPNARAETYFAITSNTFQFGARVELYAGEDIFNVYGFIGLDVLVNFNPFHFIAELAAMLAVRTGSDALFAVKLEGTLEGPTQWHARGSASFEIGFVLTVTIRVKFDAVVGEARETTLPPIDVLPELTKALANLGNWRPRLPPASNQHVSLRELPDAATRLVLHPFGALEIGQKVVPLDIAIQRFGSRVPADGGVYRIGDVKLGGAPATTTKIGRAIRAGASSSRCPTPKSSRAPRLPTTMPGLSLAASSRRARTSCAGAMSSTSCSMYPSASRYASSPGSRPGSSTRSSAARRSRARRSRMPRGRRPRSLPSACAWAPIASRSSATTT